MTSITQTLRDEHRELLQKVPNQPSDTGENEADRAESRGAPLKGVDVKLG